MELTDPYAPFRRQYERKIGRLYMAIRTCPVHGEVEPLRDSAICPRPNCRRTTTLAAVPPYADHDEPGRMPDVREGQAREAREQD